MNVTEEEHITKDLAYYLNMVTEHERKMAAYHSYLDSLLEKQTQDLLTAEKMLIDVCERK